MICITLQCNALEIVIDITTVTTTIVTVLHACYSSRTLCEVFFYVLQLDPENVVKSRHCCADAYGSVSGD